MNKCNLYLIPRRFLRALKASVPFHFAVIYREKGGKTGSIDTRGGGFVVNAEVARHGDGGVAAIGSWFRGV
jgi:hypothetical protein